jgi:hypothetical protein
MSGPTLTAEEAAEELGRSVSWLYANWDGLVTRLGMPMPLLSAKPPLTWSRAQFYAWLDKDLPKDMKLAAQAYRAAAAAAAGVRHVPAATLRDAEDRAALDRRYAR